MENINCSNCGMSHSDSLKYCKNCGYELPKVKQEIITESIHQPVQPKSKLSSKTIIGIVFGFATMFAVQHYFFPTSTYDKTMMAISSELNKSCPIMIDYETRLDNTIALPDNIFQYYYTLINTEKEKVDTTSMKNFLEPTITNFVKTNPEMKVQRDYKTTMVYYYKDKSGQYLFSISVTPDKYQ